MTLGWTRATPSTLRAAAGRPQDLAQPLLPGASPRVDSEACGREPETAFRGGQGRGRLGRSVHWTMRRSAPRPTRSRRSGRTCGTTRMPGRWEMSVAAIHEHGSLAGIELHHGGARESPSGDKQRTTASHQARSHRHSRGVVLAKEMSPSTTSPESEDDWVRAARRARDVGFDIVYVYGAHGYLLHPIPVPT